MLLLVLIIATECSDGVFRILQECPVNDFDDGPGLVDPLRNFIPLYSDNTCCMELLNSVERECWTVLKSHLEESDPRGAEVM